METFEENFTGAAEEKPAFIQAKAVRIRKKMA
jgi:hypothetical protein